MTKQTVAKRPWGYYELIDSSPCHWYKRISVNPGNRLSLQKHKKRDEFWVIECGVGKVTINDEVFDAVRGKTFFIPRDAVHRVSCTSKLSLIFTEVAVGEVSEDDIVRLEDDYNR